jgi:diaminopimelate epimerase
MSIIHFSKYSAYGNILIFIDEVLGTQLKEQEQSAFAAAVTDEHFGIGADDVIILQKYSPELIKAIGDCKRYWKGYPQFDCASDPDYVLRVIEPDGQEALCCGNGLACAAHYLHTHYGIEVSRIVTEIPSSSPKIRKTEVTESGKNYRVNMGCPSPIPETLINKSFVTHSDGVLGFFQGLPITCQWMSASGHDTTLSVVISGFLTFTGEPHLVVFEQPENSFTDDFSSLFRLIVGDDSSQGMGDKNLQNHRIDSIGIFHKIGSSLNLMKSKLFPHGINVNFARVVNKDGIIEYRTFERGVNKETLACGTGAIAVATVAYQLGMVKSNRIELWPKRGRWLENLKDARLYARRDSTGEWWLETEPKCIFSGTIEFPPS